MFVFPVTFPPNNEMKTLLVICLVILVAVAINASQFFHVSDFHLDFYYDENAEDLKQVCPSSEGNDAIDPGKFGDYSCDSPWMLIGSTLQAMKTVNPKPDFIIWTGDNGLHAKDPSKYLNETQMIKSIRGITRLFMKEFPGTKVYPTTGNHDLIPKNMTEESGNTIVKAVAEFWKDWLSPESYESFKSRGYYVEYLNEDNKTVLISLNTMLWMNRNKLVNGTTDVAGQFKWFRDQLQKAKEGNQKVYITGHVGPGFWEITSSSYYFDNHNKWYIDAINDYHDVIVGQFFAHLHTDTFRIMRDENQKPISSILFAPSVAPNWNFNPSFRIFDYERKSLKLQNYQQYFLNLTHANQVDEMNETVGWVLEYSATDAYNLESISHSSLAQLSEEFTLCNKKDRPSNSAACSGRYFEKYLLYNQASFSQPVCNYNTCVRNHICAINEVDYKRHEDCMNTWSAASAPLSHALLILSCVIHFFKYV